MACYIALLITWTQSVSLTMAGCVCTKCQVSMPDGPQVNAFTKNNREGSEKKVMWT